MLSSMQLGWDWRPPHTCTDAPQPHSIPSLCSAVVILHFISEVRLAFQPLSDDTNGQGSELMPFFPFLFLIIWTAVSLLLLWTCHKHAQNNFPTLRHSAHSGIGRSQLSSLGLIAVAHPQQLPAQKGKKQIQKTCTIASTAVFCVLGRSWRAVGHLRYGNSTVKLPHRLAP